MEESKFWRHVLVAKYGVTGRDKGLAYSFCEKF